VQLNPRQIEAFRAVMLTGSMTVAADLLKITQPAVSRLVKDLENDLNFRLFRRDGNRLIPTQEGTILFAEVDRFYVGMDRIAKIATDLRQTRAGSLRIAAISSLSLSCMTEAIRLFNAERPAVRVSLESHNSLSILELVAGRHFDIGFALVGGEFPGVSLTALPPAEAVCILPVGHALSNKEIIAPDDLEGLPFISLGKNSPFRLKIDQMFEAAGVVRQEFVETSLAATVVAMVASAMGVSIVDPFSATIFANGRTVIRPFRPRLTSDVFAVTPIHHNSRLSNEFLRIVRTLFKSLRTEDASAAGARVASAR
jgi:DNA-binding transcriptional LysR family regulator